MKKLSKLKLKEFHEMSDSEMKSIVGGGNGRATNCSTTCADGTTIQITNCIGDCTSVNASSVTCKGTSNTLTKTCNGHNNYPGY